MFVIKLFSVMCAYVDGTTIKEADGSRFIAEFVIKPQAVKL